MPPEPRRWELVLPGWRPLLANATTRGRHWSAERRAKKATAQALGAAKLLAGCPDATGPRRVSLTVTLGPRQRAGDIDAPLKVLFDSLKLARLIVDDAPKWFTWGGIVYSPNREAYPSTRIVIEEIV